MTPENKINGYVIRPLPAGGEYAWEACNGSYADRFYTQASAEAWALQQTAGQVRRRAYEAQMKAAKSMLTVINENLD